MSLLSAFGKSAFARVGIITLTLVLLALIALFYYLTYTVIASVNRSQLVASQLTSQSVVDKVDRNFYERFGDVQAFAFNQLPVEALRSDSVSADLQLFINTMTAYYVLYDLMMICDRDGRVLAVNTQDKNGKAINSSFLIGKSMAQEDWFKQCMSPPGPEGGAWYSDFMAQKLVGQIYNNPGYGMAFAAPVRDPQTGTAIGAWYNFASWKEVTDGIREEAERDLKKEHPGAFILLTNTKNEVISAHNQEALFAGLDREASVIKNNSTSSDSLKRFLVGKAQSKGAYIYKGKNWEASTFVPRVTMSWSVFFSADNFPAIAVTLVVMTAITYYVTRYFRHRIVLPIAEISQAQQTLSRGEVVHLKLQDRGDEIGEMGKSLVVLTENLTSKAMFADEIANGNLEASIASASNSDRLANSLINMRDQLRKNKEADRQRVWETEGMAEIGKLLRSQVESKELYLQIVKFVVKYVGANQGALFLLSEESDQPFLELVSCYAYDKKKFLQKKIEIGQGLVGQCYLEKQTCHLKQVPSNYIAITSGLGQATPRTLLVVPLVQNEVVHGVLEIASFRYFQDFEITLIEKLGESIAASVSSLRMQEQTQLLLQRLQQQTEEMKSQEEEMRQNLEELSATQEEMLRKEKEYLKRIHDLEAATQEVGVLERNS